MSSIFRHPCAINNNKLEKRITFIKEAFRGINIDINEMDIDACLRLHVKSKAVNEGKRVSIKFVKRKHAEAILSKTFILSSTDFSVYGLRPLLLSRWDPYYCPTYVRCFQGPTNPPPYTIIHTVFNKKKAWFIIFKIIIKLTST